MAYQPEANFPDSCNQLPEGPSMGHQGYGFNQLTHPPMGSLTTHELSMLSGSFHGQIPPGYNSPNTSFMTDSFEYEAHNPGSQVHTPTPVPKKGSARKTVSPRKQTSARPSHSPLTCQWSKCNKPFSHKTTLVRHVVTQHLDPGSVPCLDEECFKVFNRKDNMMAHFRTVHADDS